METEKKLSRTNLLKKLGKRTVSKHNQKRRGIVNLNLTIVKKSSGLSSKAIERKAAKEFMDNLHAEALQENNK